MLSLSKHLYRASNLIAAAVEMFRLRSAGRSSLFSDKIPLPCPMKSHLLALVLCAGSLSAAHAQTKPEETEVYEPVPPVVTPAKTVGDAPADALVLFDGKNLDQWVSTDKNPAPANWTVAGGILTVKKDQGNIETKRSFGNYQLHLEWRIPANISGTGQARGNSGVFLASTGSGDQGYELQIVDAYQNKTY